MRTPAAVPSLVRFPSRGLARVLSVQAAGGFALGFVALHPISMAVFRWLDPVYAGAMNEHSRISWWGPILHSFQPDMFSMGMAFGFVGALAAVVFGYNRAVISWQKNELVKELAANQEYREVLEAQAEVLNRQNVKLAAFERANRRTTQFMVHDFKTNLSCILGFAGLLLDRVSAGRDVREELPATLARIERQADMMQEGVRQLLDFARLQGGQELKFEDTSVMAIFEQAVGGFPLPEQVGRVSMGSRCTRCPPVRCDPRIVTRAVSNLISNALKHNPPGTRVVIDAEAGAENECVTFSCSDNGAGIPSGVGTKLFEEFSGTSRTSNGDSTGLGLAFCKLAVEAHGGRIWYENNDEAGVTFYFTIPIYGERMNDD